MADLPTIARSAARDHRVDFYRGVALLMIFVNHVPGTALETLTTRNFGFSDSAELFVFLAGFASAFAYGRAFLGGSALVASLKAARRAGTLYLVHVALTMLTVSAFVTIALATGEGRYVMELGIGYFTTMPLDALAGVATLGHQLAYLNILPLYCVILLMLPAMLAIVRRFGAPAMLTLSGTLWLACGIWRFNLPNHPNPGGWNFDPFAWQFVFAIGLAAGLAKAQGRALVAFQRPLYAAALAYLVFAFAIMALGLQGMAQDLPLHSMVRDLDKTFVSLPRLFHLLALVYVFAHAPAASPLQRIAADNPLARLGRHSLPIFAVGTMLSMLCQIVRLDRGDGPVLDVALIAAGIALQLGLAYALDWWRMASAPVAVAARAGEPAARCPHPAPRSTTAADFAEKGRSTA